MVTAVHETTPTGRLKETTVTLIYVCILAAWDLTLNDPAVKSQEMCASLTALTELKMVLYVMVKIILSILKKKKKFKTAIKINRKNENEIKKQNEDKTHI